jgi:hypothetical protein
MSMKNSIVFAVLLFQSIILSGQSPTRPLFDTKTICEIKIQVQDSLWVQSLDSLRIYGNEMLEAKVNIDGQNYTQTGLRFRGNQSYQFGLKRNPFHIKLDRTNASQNHQGHKSIRLSSALRDPSFVREMLFLETAAKYISTPKAAYAKLYINGEYLGVFVLIESIDKKFLLEHFGSSDGALYKAGIDHKPKTPPQGCLENISGSLEFEQNPECLANNFEIESSQTNFTQLHNLTTGLKNDPKALASLINIDETLWMLALNNVMVNLSSYTGKNSENYFLYQDKFAQFRPMHWDLNLAFGSYKNIGTGSDLDLKSLQRLDPELHSNNIYKPLISKLLADPLNKKIYFAHMRQILNDQFLNGNYERRARELQSLIVIPFSEDPNKPYALEQFQQSLSSTIGRKTKIPGIVELMGKRVKYLKSHPSLSAVPSISSDIQFVKREKYENTAVKAFQISLKADKYAKRAILYYRFAESEQFKALTLQDGPKVANQGSGMRAFEGVIEAAKPDAQLEYYILIENAGTVSYSPANYTEKKYKISLADINRS